MLMKPTSSHRMAALTAVLGSKGAHQSIHLYRDNDVTTSLANAKHSKYAVYRKEMGNPIAQVARRAPPLYTTDKSKILIR